MMYEIQQVRMEMKRIKEKKTQIEIEKVEEADLSGMSLTTLPNPSFNLAILHKLDLSNNHLERIPESLTARLRNVVVLDMHSNQLKSLPNSIGCLFKLRHLNVSGNLLESLPKTIENCRSLEELNANFNRLKSLPETMGFELNNLQKLSVNSNMLAYLPYTLSHLTNLRILDARLNCLRSLPDGLENLIHLEILTVSQNFQYLMTLPYSIGLLISLVELDISYNKISMLPDSMGCLKKLQKLSVQGNPLVSPPIEVVEQGVGAVKEYLSDRMNSPSKANKNKSWLGKMVRWKTFNASSSSHDDRDSFVMSDYRSINGLTSPRSSGTFSPRRLFSPRSRSFSR
ncbi:Plant intracellular Ras-group-related LRR protein 6 [Ranunculus cassubicifolius]